MDSTNYYGGRGYSAYPSKGSSAYDWSLFEGREVDYTSNRKPREKSGEKRNRKKPAAASAAAKKSRLALAANQRERAYCVVFCLLLFVALGIMITGYVQEHEIAQQLEDANRTLTGLEQEYEALNITLDNEMNSSALESYATDVLGMQKREGSQTEYITLGGKDVFEYTEETGLGTWFREETDRVMSYFD